MDLDIDNPPWFATVDGQTLDFHASLGGLGSSVRSDGRRHSTAWSNNLASSTRSFRGALAAPGGGAENEAGGYAAMAAAVDSGLKDTTHLRSAGAVRGGGKNKVEDVADRVGEKGFGAPLEEEEEECDRRSSAPVEDFGKTGGGVRSERERYFARPII